MQEERKLILIVYYSVFNPIYQKYLAGNQYKDNWGILHSLFHSKYLNSGVYFTLTAHLCSD